MYLQRVDICRVRVVTEERSDPCLTSNTVFSSISPHAHVLIKLVADVHIQYAQLAFEEKAILRRGLIILPLVARSSVDQSSWIKPPWASCSASLLDYQ